MHDNWNCCFHWKTFSTSKKIKSERNAVEEIFYFRNLIFKPTPMKIVKGILITLVILVLIIVAVGFLSPRHVQVERSLTMKAPQEIVHAQINNLKNWNKWSPWYKLDTTMKMEYNDIEAGTGASFKWDSQNKNVGKGDMTITASAKDSISTAMNFMEHGTATAKFILTKENDGTKVSWIMESDMGNNPIGRIFGLFMDKMVGKDFENGLANLKTVSEAMPVKQKSIYEVKEEDAPEMVYAGKKDSMSWGQMTAFFMKNLPTLGEPIKKAKVEMAGPPSGLYFTWDTVNKSTVMAAAVRVKGNAKTKVSGLETFVVPAGKVLHIAYYGGYSGIGAAHNAIQNYIDKKGLIKRMPVI